MPGGIVRRWRHLPLRRPAPGGLAAARGPQRCDIVAVRTVTLSHRGGCGAVAGAAAARREGPARREGARGAAARPCARRSAAHSRRSTRMPRSCCWDRDARLTACPRLGVARARNANQPHQHHQHRIPGQQWVSAGRRVPGNRTQVALAPPAPRSGCAEPAGTPHNPRFQCVLTQRKPGFTASSGRPSAVRRASGRWPAGARECAAHLPGLATRASAEMSDGLVTVCPSINGMRGRRHED
jgi:hypothetical protein